MVRPHNNMKKQVMNDDRKVKPHYNTNHNLKNNSIHDMCGRKRITLSPLPFKNTISLDYLQPQILWGQECVKIWNVWISEELVEP